MAAVARSALRKLHLPVAIIGNGLGAFTSALSLHRAGVRNNIFIPNSKLTRPARQAVFLGGSAVRILDRLGLGSDFRVLGSPMNHAEVLDKNGREIISFELIGIGGEVWTVPKDRLLQLFLEAIPPESVHFNCKPHSVRVGKTGVEINMCRTGDHMGPIIPPRATLLDADFVIGADSVSSSVRMFLSQTVMTMPSGVTVWGAVIRHMNLDEIPLHVVREIWDGNRRFGFVRVTHDEVMWWAIISSHNQVILRPFASRLQRTFNDFPKLVNKLISAIDTDRQIDRQEMKRVWPQQSPWIDRTSSRVALVGDARRPGSAETFHVGNSFAVDDAYILAHVIIDQKSRYEFEGDGPLEKYDENREQNLQVTRKLSRQVQRLANASSFLDRYIVKPFLRQAVEQMAYQGMSSFIVTSPSLSNSSLRH